MTNWAAALWIAVIVAAVVGLFAWASPEKPGIVIMKERVR
jgi:hypothetical protein